REPLQRIVLAADASGVVSAAGTGDYEGASAALAASYQGATVAEVHPADLDEAYGGDLGSFGFAKLALLNDALASGAAKLAFSREGEAVVIDVAAPVRDRASLVGVAYARLPLPDLAGTVSRVTPAGGYLAVLSDDLRLAQAGDMALAADAVRTEVPGAPLSVASA